MLEPLVSAAFWILFPIGCLLTAARLLAVVLQNHRLSAVRWHLDDGRDEGQGYEVYRLTLASGRLVRAVSAVAALHGATAVAALAGGAWFKGAALFASVAWVLASDAVRERHARLERTFEREAGAPLGAFYRDMHEGETTLA